MGRGRNGPRAEWTFNWGFPPPQGPDPCTETRRRMGSGARTERTGLLLRGEGGEGEQVR